MTVGARPGALVEESPYGIPSRKLGMWLFILADAATFGAMLFAYGYLRVANPDWTRPFAFWPTIANGIAMTVVLLTSSLTMVAAVAAAQAGRQPASLRWLGVTIGLGETTGLYWHFVDLVWMFVFPLVYLLNVR